jgi:hypothetical protein
MSRTQVAAVRTLTTTPVHGLATIAIQTFDPSRRQSSIDLIDPLGRAKHLDVEGQLISPEP